MRYSTQQRLIAIAFLCFVIAAFTRGSFLLGTAAGILFGALATATLFVVWRVFAKNRKFQLARQIVATLFAFAVITILTFPAQLNPDLAILIDGRQTERATRSQLQNVFSSDPRFSRLRYQCNYRKCIVVSVNGNIKTESDLLDLRATIFNNCPHVSSRWLYWKLTVEDSGVTHGDCDLTIFGDPADNSG